MDARLPQKIPVRFAIAGFVDLGRAWKRPPTITGYPFQVDVGLGIRAKIPGGRGWLRLDVGEGVRDGSRAVTLDWQF